VGGGPTKKVDKAMRIILGIFWLLQCPVIGASHGKYKGSVSEGKGDREWGSQSI
jgi:hypothetical protein